MGLTPFIFFVILNKAKKIGWKIKKMGKELLEGSLKRIRAKIKEEKGKQEKGEDEKKCTGPCIFPDCHEPLHGEVQKCDWLGNNDNGKCCTKPN